MKLKLTKLLLMQMLVITSSCSFAIKPGYFADDQKVAEQAVKVFHARLSDEKYEEIYSQTADVFRQTASKADLLSAMRQTREQLGPLKSTEQTEANVVMGTPRQVKLVYKTQYENEKATEEFIWFVDGNEAKLASYSVSSSQ